MSRNTYFILGDKMGSEKMKEYWRRCAEIINTKFPNKKAKDDAVFNLFQFGLGGKRLVMTGDVDDYKIFAATLDDIKKHNYRLVENVPRSEWGLDDHDLSDDERREIEQLRKNMISINNILDSG